MIAVIIIILFGILSYLLKKLTLSGSIGGILLASLLYFAFEWLGLSMLMAFFALATIATSWKKHIKQDLLKDHADEAIRSWPNVLGNGGIAGILAIVAFIWPGIESMCTIGMAASFATTCSDTLSSEFGNVYGSRFLQIKRQKQAKRGDNGVISPEGSMAGIIGAFLIALVFFAFHQEWSTALIIAIAGISGNFSDTLLGAFLENRGKLNNHQVNALAALFGCITALSMSFLV